MNKRSAVHMKKGFKKWSMAFYSLGFSTSGGMGKAATDVY